MSACASDQGPTREIVLVARGMSFVDGRGDVANPDISLKAGERVRVVLKNEAPGLLHDFEIPAWNVAMDQLRDGESGEVTFRVPDTPGRFEYRCRPHSAMMSGFVEVTR
jgi:plastocyanin